MGRIDGERRQNWEQVILEVTRQPVAVLVGQGRGAHDEDILAGEILLQHGERGLLFHLQVVDLLEDLVQLLGRRLAIRAAHQNALADLAFEACHAHHEEFVEIGGRDRQEAHPLQKWMSRVQRFFQDAAIELQPGEFAVDEPRGAFQKIDGVLMGGSLHRHFLRFRHLIHLIPHCSTETGNRTDAGHPVGP